jgi:hypothetical protein
MLPDRKQAEGSRVEKKVTGRGNNTAETRKTRRKTREKAGGEIQPVFNR